MKRLNGSMNPSTRQQQQTKQQPKFQQQQYKQAQPMYQMNDLIMISSINPMNNQQQFHKTQQSDSSTQQLEDQIRYLKLQLEQKDKTIEQLRQQNTIYQNENKLLTQKLQKSSNFQCKCQKEETKASQKPIQKEEIKQQFPDINKNLTRDDDYGYEDSGDDEQKKKQKALQERAARMVRGYAQSDIERIKFTKCAISDQMEGGYGKHICVLCKKSVSGQQEYLQLKCGHASHKTCISVYLMRERKCPSQTCQKTIQILEYI
eukprot:403370189